MLYLLFGLTGLLMIVALFTFFSKKANEKTEPIQAPEAGCCGAHAVCEKGLKKIETSVEYFDDEELDAFKGIPSDKYTDAQLDMFRDVLYTLQNREIDDWFISLEKREIQFPELLKQEALDLISH